MRRPDSSFELSHFGVLGQKQVDTLRAHLPHILVAELGYAGHSNLSNPRYNTPLCRLGWFCSLKRRRRFNDGLQGWIKTTALMQWHWYAQRRLKNQRGETSRQRS